MKEAFGSSQHHSGKQLIFALIDGTLLNALIASKQLQ